MADPIRLQFRPSLIIFVDEAGQEIRDYLSLTTLDDKEQLVLSKSSIRLLASLDEPLRQCVGLLHVSKADPDNPDSPLRAIPLPAHEAFPHDYEAPTEAGPLADLIKETLRNVQLYRRRRAVEDMGYMVRNPRTQIYIVGDTSSLTDLSWVLHAVREQLSQAGFDTLVCCVLNSFDASRRPVIPSNNQWAQRAVANYCYLYEDIERHPDPNFITRREAYYAAAEALFAFIATGITMADPLIDYTKQPTIDGGSYQNVGTFSTSMIIFPRAAIQRYCSDDLGSDLLEQWIRDLNNAVISNDARKAQQDRAQKDVDIIASWIQDEEPRPGARGSKWPSLSILTKRIPMQPPRDDYTQEEMEQRRQEERDREHLEYTQTDVYNKRLEQTRDLFRRFSTKAMTDAYKNRQYKSDTWTEIAYERVGKAADAFRSWDLASSTAWRAAGARVSANVQHVVDQLWPNPNNGFELARIYIDQFDHELAQLADSIAALRVAHERSYKEALGEFADKANERDWGIPPNAASNLAGGGAGVARPTMGNQHVGPGGPIPATPGGQGGPFIGGGGAPPRPGSPVYHHLPKHEEEISGLLEQRIIWKQKQVPSLLAQITLSATFLVALALLGRAILPTILPHVTGLLQLLIALPILLAIIAGNWFLRRQRQQQVKAAQEDFLSFYRRYYAYRCERREDAHRLSVLSPLRQRVLRIRERFDDMDNFLQTVMRLLRQDAEQTRNDLFDGPAGSRDIFIGKGERLQKEDPRTVNVQRQSSFTLEDFAEKVTLKRVQEPIELWHRDLEDIRNALIRELQRTESIIEMSEEDAQEHITNFAQRIITQYLTGELVDIGAALDKPEIWRKVVERVQRPLYSAQVGIRDPHIYFICGRDEHIARARKYIPAGTIPVTCANAEWLLMAAFYRSGESATLDTNTLFPLLTARPPTTYAGTGGHNVSSAELEEDETDREFSGDDENESSLRSVPVFMFDEDEDEDSDEDDGEDGGDDDTPTTRR